jgi:hypothetical protein
LSATSSFSSFSCCRPLLCPCISIAMVMVAPAELPPPCRSIRPSYRSAAAHAAMAARRANQAPTAARVEPAEQPLLLLPRPPPWLRVELTELPPPRLSSAGEPSCSSYHQKLLVNQNIARNPLEITRDSTRNYSRICYC